MRAPARLLFASIISMAVPSAESFDEAWQRLKKGRSYGPEKTGRFSIKYRAPDGEQFDNVVDESRIYLTGISDGGTGAYDIAMKAATIWSSVLPLNGSMAVIRSPMNGADGEMFGNNLTNTPLYIVNGEEDQLYPVRQVEPHVK
jgi:poly(3-hydroxybutyrate) depolymerase